VEYDPLTYKENLTSKNETIGMIYSQDPEDETCTYKPSAPPYTAYTYGVPPLQKIQQVKNISDPILTALPTQSSNVTLRIPKGNCVVKDSAGNCASAAGVCTAAPDLYKTCDDIYVRKNIVDIFNSAYGNFPQITKINASSTEYNVMGDDAPICHYDVNFQVDSYNQIISDRKIVTFRLVPSTTRRTPMDFLDDVFNPLNTETTTTVTLSPNGGQTMELNVKDVSKFTVGDSVLVFKKQAEKKDAILGL
jgi:hypothetical protein